MIVRAKRNTNFTIMSNVGLEDSRLSLKAKGMLAYLLSKPDNWQVSDRQLATIGPDGRAAVQAALKELETFGYLKRTKVRNEDGTFSWHSTVYDEPWPDYPATVHPATVHPATDNRAKISTVVTRTEEQVLIEEVLSDSDAPKQGDSLTPQQEMFGAICEAIGWDYKAIQKKDQAQVAQACKALAAAQYTVDDIRRFMTDIWFKDWRWEKKQQYPTLSQLRQEIGKLRSLVPSAAPQPKQKGMAGYREMLEREGIHL